MKSRALFASLAFFATAFFPALAQDYLGVNFEPYVGNWTGSPEPNPPAFNSYTMPQVQAMLQTVRPSFDRIITLSAGYASYYTNATAWDKVDSDWMVGIAAANINVLAGQKVLDVAQGIYQQVYPGTNTFTPLMDAEVNGALSIAENANKLFPQTVTRLVFTNDFFVDAQSTASLTALVGNYTEAAHAAGLEVGVRSLYFGQLTNKASTFSTQLAALVKQCDFILCNLYPTQQESITAAVNDVAAQYDAIDKAAQAIHPGIEVQIGATGWPSSGVSVNNTTNTLANEEDYFNAIQAWANQNHVMVYFYEAADEPWRINVTAFGDSLSDGPNGADSHYGLWYAANGNLTAKFTIPKLVAEPPAILIQPANTTVTAPAAANFSVLAADTTPLSFQWQISTNGGATFTNLVNGTGISGATSATLSFKPTTGNLIGDQVRCVLSDGSDQTTSAVAHLVVNAPPIIVTQSGNVTVLAPTPANFTVAAIGVGLTYQWQIAANSTAAFVNLANGNGIGGVGSANLTINPTTGNLNGARLRCVVGNPYGTMASTPALLVVNTPPAIVTQPASQAIPPGGSVTFSVVAVGTPPLAYQWEKNNVIISGVGASLSLGDVTPASAGNYTVTVKNGFGNVTSVPATLLVGVPPVFTTQPVNATVTAPAAAHFSAVATGTGPLVYQWQEQARGALLFTNLADGNGISGSSTPNLTINPTSAKLSGVQFRCLASNPLGIINSNPATLTVQ
jgi:exo-beta-1,3-glucanase (GH17 family)